MKSASSPLKRLAMTRTAIETPAIEFRRLPPDQAQEAMDVIPKKGVRSFFSIGGQAQSNPSRGEEYNLA